MYGREGFNRAVGGNTLRGRQTTGSVLVDEMWTSTKEREVEDIRKRQQDTRLPTSTCKVLGVCLVPTYICDK